MAFGFSLAPVGVAHQTVDVSFTSDPSRKAFQVVVSRYQLGNPKDYHRDEFDVPFANAPAGSSALDGGTFKVSCIVPGDVPVALQLELAQTLIGLAFDRLRSIQLGADVTGNEVAPEVGTHGEHPPSA